MQTKNLTQLKRTMFDNNRKIQHSRLNRSVMPTIKYLFLIYELCHSEMKKKDNQLTTNWLKINITLKTKGKHLKMSTMVISRIWHYGWFIFPDICISLFSKFPSMAGGCYHSQFWKVIRRMRRGLSDWIHMDMYQLERERGAPEIIKDPDAVGVQIAHCSLTSLNPFSPPSSTLDCKTRDYILQPCLQPSIAIWLRFYQGK